MIAILADYRVKTRNYTTIEDAQAALRWIREHASLNGADPDRIAAAGGSAGGHLAAATETIPRRQPTETEDQISSRPDALFLFNPVLARVPGIPEDNEWLQSRSRGLLENVSPFHHVSTGMPPTWIFHGMEDSLVPIETAGAFCERVNENGDEC